jgi:hypothetical protein
VTVALWIVQVLLALFWRAAGWNRGLRPLHDDVGGMPYQTFLRSIEPLGNEWLKEHAWKTKLANDIKPLRRASTHTRSAT